MNKIKWIFLVILLFISGCNKQITRHTLPRGAARAIYVGSQVEKLRTDGRLPKEEIVIVEILTYHGKRYQGRLFQITDADVLLSEGYTTKTAGQRTFKEEQLIEIPKSELVVVKVW